MQVTLQADQRPKQNHKNEFLPAHPRELYLLGRGLGLMLNQENIRSPIIQCRRKWPIFFVMEAYLETMMERLNSGELKIIFRIISCIVIIGLTKSGRAAWQEEEDKRKDFIIVLILQEQFYTSELFKVIQDAALLILNNRTMSLFRTFSSSTFITSDVQSIYIPSSIQDWYLEDKIWATDRQYSFCLWIPWTENTRILKHRVLHNTCTQHGRNIKIRCIGSTSTLLWRKDGSSNRDDRTPPFFTKHSQLIVSRKLFGWKLEKSKTRKCMRHLGIHQRFSWNMIGWRNWVQKLLDNQKEKLLDNQKVPNQANQIQTQNMRERGDPLFAQKTRPVLRKSTQVSLVTARTPI